MFLFLFVLGAVVVEDKQNSTKPTNKPKTDDVSINVNNSTAVYNYNHDPNVPPTKSAACIIL